MPNPYRDCDPIHDVTSKLVSSHLGGAVAQRASVRLAAALEPIAADLVETGAGSAVVSRVADDGHVLGLGDSLGLGNRLSLGGSGRHRLKGPRLVVGAPLGLGAAGVRRAAAAEAV